MSVGWTRGFGSAPCRGSGHIRVQDASNGFELRLDLAWAVVHRSSAGKQPVAVDPERFGKSDQLIRFGLRRIGPTQPLTDRGLPHADPLSELCLGHTADAHSEPQAIPESSEDVTVLGSSQFRFVRFRYSKLKRASPLHGSGP